MKRSNSAPCLFDEEIKAKRMKTSNDQSGPNTREYLQLALARIIELQTAIKDNTYFSNDSCDQGDEETDEDLMRDVLMKVFKDLPGSSSSVPSIIERATRKLPAEIHRLRGKSIQLSGYDTCRKLTLDFMKTAVRNVSLSDNQVNEIGRDERSQRRETLCSEYEIRARMLRGLDLHLAIKQRDYTYKLMRL